MGDKMRPISLKKMITWTMEELKEKESIFGIHKNKFYKNDTGKYIELFGERLASPLGPAAGPNSQLTQNIVASYLTGSRFIELKTIQVIDGEDLPVAKPCIHAQDECYNVEWSTELTVPEAYDEYIKAWFLLHVLMKELNLSEERDFMFNMSVGYDLDGIKSPKVDVYIEGMRNASTTKIWNECRETLLSNIDLFSNFSIEDLDKISPVVCPSITLSTLHGCPPEEIEKIAKYLLEEKNLHTFIKMNPTLLGEKFVRDTFDKMGYDYIVLNPNHFINDLQYKDGVSMLKRLKSVAQKLKLEIGVKLTNTLPVKIENGELPGEEMYMSGRSLFPLTISLANKLASEFDGDLQISYSGGADFFNIEKILKAGIQPITFATTILKPGGYERIAQMAQKVEEYLKGAFKGIDIQYLNELANSAVSDKYHLKDLRPVNSRKISLELPIYDCAVAPCTIGCPINQQIPEYVSLVGEKKYDEAFEVIAKDNTSPAITGTICNHNCQYKCTRLDYDESVLIRDMKKVAVLNAEDKYIEDIKEANIRSDKKVAVIGAGPAGLSVALFLRRNGIDVTVMDIKEKPYGVIEYVIPEFRISSEMIKKDFELVKKQGVKFKFGIDENLDLDALKKEYDYVVLAIGAWKPGKLTLKEGGEKAIDAISFLENHKKSKGDINLGKHVCIIGGGDVAMDAARAAKRTNGVEEVSIVYRRTKKYMPASLEEIELVQTEGILFKELLSPMSIKDSKLICEEMKLGKKDASGRRKPVGTGNTVELEADTVILAVGQQVDSDLLKKNKIELDAKGFPKINEARETNITNVYVAGDMKKGPATIVKAMADGKAVSKDILSKEGLSNDFDKKVFPVNEEKVYSKKGILKDHNCLENESERCLSCSNICELCVDVCPNRANVVINVDAEFNSSHQIVHLDGMCNECGNCGIFCPYEGNPYKDKLTLFWTKEDFENSTNKGFLVIDKDKGICKVRREDTEIIDYTIEKENDVSKEMDSMIKTFINEYGYML
ncbi:putative selenate reductase subunit YgfK [Clostridium botulinum]|uniref:putative selenate reductase subunit YgfK n=1 Tax=Clostridium botulinum TaxID=1491 RepID=UPI001C9B581F|nr:putative selenate reductase subunit YgfK [Clostridium botulinum]MBY6794879.1 putative selenate reductase subunit YgfK [Clostridium botulinum]MBY6866185.1 putative selenate reductase subunit YgfK [Clostridium botulinum]